MSGAAAVGLYGKISAQADFFRANAGEFSQAGLDRWFELALETMRGEGGHLPDGPTGFLLAPRGSSRVFVGAFAPSHDAAGRMFPLLAFTHRPAPKIANGPTDGLARLFLDQDGFVAASATLAVEGGQIPVSDLSARAEALSGNDDVRNPQVPDIATFSDQPAENLRLSMGGTPRAVAYGLRTIGLACDQASKYGPDAASGVITVDAPSADPAAAWMWLEIVARRLSWREGLPSMLWTIATSDRREGRMLLTLGPPSPSVLGYLANPRHRSSRFWPLRTDVSAAIDQAWQAVSAEQRGLLESSTTSLGQLVDSFGGKPVSR